MLTVGSLLGVLGVFAGLVNTRLWVSEPLLCLAAGVALGPVGLGEVRIDVAHDPQAASVLLELAQATLAVSVLAGAMRLPTGWLRRQWRGLAVALGPGMLAMWVVGSAAALVLGAPWAICLLLGAVLTPTDPVLSAPIVTGRLAEGAVPPDLRHAITAESAANDGLAAPLVKLALVLAGLGSGGLAHWAWETVMWETGVSVAGGAAVGALAGWALDWAERRQDSDPAPLLTIALSLTAILLAGMEEVDGNGVLAAFVAGCVLNEAGSQAHEERQEHFNEGFTRFFDLPVMVLFGAVLPWPAWQALGWRGVGFTAILLLVRRLPAWILLGRLMPWTRRRPEALFAGWFGPIGAAALFYACEIGTVRMPLIWAATSLVVFASVLAHGVTGTALTHHLRRVLRRAEAGREAVPP